MAVEPYKRYSSKAERIIEGIFDDLRWKKKLLYGLYENISAFWGLAFVEYMYIFIVTSA